MQCPEYSDWLRVEGLTSCWCLGDWGLSWECHHSLSRQQPLSLFTHTINSLAHTVYSYRQLFLSWQWTLIFNVPFTKIFVYSCLPYIIRAEHRSYWITYMNCHRHQWQRRILLKHYCWKAPEVEESEGIHTYINPNVKESGSYKTHLC